MNDARIRAGRRLDLGLALLDDGDLGAGCMALDDAIAEDPDWAEAHFARAEALSRAGRTQDAAAAFQAYLARDPEDRMGAGPRLALLGAAKTPDRLPPAYVEALFDEFSGHYDGKMRGRLGYRGPELIAEALLCRLDRLGTAPSILDLGCGTGLVGRAVRALAGRLDGVDLSEGMLRKAARTGLYARLTKADLVADPWTDGTDPDLRYDAVVAGDVLNYLGDLAPVFVKASAALRPGGLFVFTVEAADTPGPELGPGCRFRHHERDIQAWAHAALFENPVIRRDVLRTEKCQPVGGFLVSAEARHMPVPEDLGPGSLIPPTRPVA